MRLTSAAQRAFSLVEASAARALRHTGAWRLAMDKSSKTLFVIFRREVSPPSLLHQSPSLEAIVRKPARRQDVRLGDELLEFAPPIAERTAAQISCPDLDRIEGDVGEGRYCDVGGRGIVQEMESADEVRIEHRRVSINDCRPRGKLGHGASDVGEAGRVVLAGPTHQVNVAAFLDGDNAPAVHLLLDTHPSQWKGLARAGAIGGNQCQDVEGTPPASMPLPGTVRPEGGAGPCGAG